MKKRNAKIYTVLAIAIVLVTSLIIIGFADGNSPGSAEDPIVTQSYVTQAIDQLRSYVDGLFSNIKTDITNLNSSVAANGEGIGSLKSQLDAKSMEIAALQEQLKNATATSFQVVFVKKGTTMLSGEGTEIIVRSGICVAIASANAGLADVTDGKDLKTNDQIINNHLLISSRNDGRGLKASEDSYLLVKGSYTLK
ncbi:MAG: hypothetical protein ACOZCL_17295 [Bacillota bacterium]